MYTITPVTNVKKEIEVCPDKSISHRAVITASIATGKTLIEPFLLSDDTLTTLECIRSCGIGAVLKGKSLTIEGAGKYLPVTGELNLFAKESGTTMRILSGVLSGQEGASFKFSASPSLLKRPMGRITTPLRMMGADIEGNFLNNEEYPPLRIKPAKALKSINYKMPVASAQVKSAIIYASLYAKGVTRIIEPFVCRDHTERIVRLFGGKLQREGKTIVSRAEELCSPGKLFIPADFSSAAFFVVLGLILKRSRMLVKNVNINPTRCGLLAVLKRMGAQVKIVNKKNYYEPYADILVKSSQLKATQVKETEVPLMIDEIPLLAVAASFAKGKTRIWAVGELKVKETNRIDSMVYNLKRGGVKIEAKEYTKNKKKNWMVEIEGRDKLKPADFKSFSDHRTAMSMVVLGKALDNSSTVDDIKCINKSFPEFISLIDAL
ncbi:MAG: 3-phosphoshikimate 1-carboxyvinyltransferase [Candidatus Omnitrophota bacterium]|nr:MAG: 3-phosphoshikimate 1-carboxyvinyltransferase [Candidatus Omnitrophota bacterium]